MDGRWSAGMGPDMVGRWSASRRLDMHILLHQYLAYQKNVLATLQKQIEKDCSQAQSEDALQYYLLSHRY